MPKSIRIKTEPGIDKNINVKIDQDFDFLEILSLKLRQEDVYTRFCADYGVVVGRVIANGGYGVPNAHVSVFVPIDAIDENDEIISTLYPYKTPTSKNEDGFRYNLLPYQAEYSGHIPTGTFPTRDDVLRRSEVLQVYEKYYKYSVRTNESGDFMIVGVPLGSQKVVMDLDLSNMGCFSLRPQDLIRMNLGVESQFNGSQFKSSTDIDSLPQIIHEIKDIDVASFWGQEDSCDVGITRVDFDLRELGIEFQPTATFMGSIFSSPDNQMMKKNCKPKTEQGDLCGLVTGPGEILALRQTINIDANGDPILEQYVLPNGGKVIDDNGTFLTEVPMNLDYVYTNEFGEEVISPDGTKGIPTKAKYRFKIKYQSEENGPEVVDGIFTKMAGEIMRANYIVPQIREHGWTGTTSNSGDDPALESSATTESNITFNDTTSQIETLSVNVPNINNNGGSFEVISNSSVEKVEVLVNGEVRTEKWVDLPNGGTVNIRVTKIPTAGSSYSPVTIDYKIHNYQYSQFIKSYAFSLDWGDYADKVSAIKCEDSFYDMTYNKVYTTAQLIEEYRKGSGRARFIGIKEIIDRGCENDTVRFPVNDGVRNFDFLFFIFNILITFLSIVLLPLTIIGHVICFLWPILRWLLIIVGTVILGAIVILCYIVKGLTFGLVKWECPRFQLVNISPICPLSAIPLPNLSYPDCQSCECEDRRAGQNEDVPEVIANTSPMANTTDYLFYNELFQLVKEDGDFTYDEKWNRKFLYGVQSTMSGIDLGGNAIFERCPFTKGDDNPFTNKETWSGDLPIAERMNLFNVKANYHHDKNGARNRIKVEVNPDIPANVGQFHHDNVIVMLMDSGMDEVFTEGQLVTFRDPSKSLDPNISGGTTGTTILTTGTTGAISGTTVVSYMNFNNPSSNSLATYVITADTLNTEYKYPTDIEYYQVITTVTLEEFETYRGSSGYSNYKNPSNNNDYGDLANYAIFGWNKVDKKGKNLKTYPEDQNKKDLKFSKESPTIKLNSDWKSLTVTFLVRGVDPNSPRQDIRYDLSHLLRKNPGTVTVRGQYKMNIPIQRYDSGFGWKIPRHDNINNNNQQSENQYIYYPSYTFTPDVNQYTSYRSKALLDYSAYDDTNKSRWGEFGDSSNPSLGISNSYAITTVPTNQALAVSKNGDWSILANTKTNKFDKKEYYFNYRNEVIVEGGSAMYCKDKTDYSFFSPIYARGTKSTYSSHEVNMSDNIRIVMRTDRLPSSDTYNNRFVLHQNKSFSYYLITDEGDVVGSNLGSSIFFDEKDDFAEDSSYAAQILDTFSCETMVPLECYSGDGQTIGVYPTDNECYYVDKKKEVEKMTKGCYYLITKNFAIKEDFQSIGEWKARFRMMFALCRNVVSLSFVNNWVNGSLYMYSFQKEDLYDLNPNSTTYNTLPTYNYCKETIVFQENNNSFFYRVSPFNKNTDKFTGKKPPTKKLFNKGDNYDATNLLLLGSPTTIMDLGPRDQFIQEVCFNPEYEGYIADRIASTSYKDTSDILQLFVISRLMNSKFLQQIIGAGDASISRLFSREKSRLDADVVQALSINSEFGVIPFLGNNYNDVTDIKFLKSPNEDPVIGLFFSANTVNRDLITPGRITFADTNTTFLTNNYGFKDQRVPFHPWKIQDNTTNNPSLGKIIFGTQTNDWDYKLKKPTDIKTINYQTIDRLLKDPTFPSDGINPTTRVPGYIYNTTTSTTGTTGNLVPYEYSNKDFNSNDFKLLVGAPYHFYFGLKIGKTAMNRFIDKYIPITKI